MARPKARRIIEPNIFVYPQTSGWYWFNGFFYKDSYYRKRRGWHKGIVKVFYYDKYYAVSWPAGPVHISIKRLFGLWHGPLKAPQEIWDLRHEDIDRIFKAAIAKEEEDALIAFPTDI